jgi:outer membrane receptor protein involved in Fe transport
VVALSEADPGAGRWTADASFGSLGLGRGGVTADIPLGPGALLISAAGEHSDGWIPVIAGRGAADQPLTLDDRSASIRFRVDGAAITQVWRAAAYDEERGAGLVGAGSRARGASLGFSAARAPEPATLGWRAQTWLQVSDLANTSVSVAANRQTASLSNDQYETPAIGYGVNGAVRALWRHGTLELGADLRGAVGEDRETFRPVSGVLTKVRYAGGQTLTGGVYGEATAETGALLLTAGARVDGWDTFDSHRLESVIATGLSTLDDRGGVLHSGRLGARLGLGGGTWLRAAAYTGFRAPSLNELFRPFRVGNNITEANPALTPERLYGAEIGAGGDMGRARWSVTGFYNRLDNPVTNVTLDKGPYTDPVEGVIPAGGLLIQRRNIGAVNAYGVEAEGDVSLMDGLGASGAVSWTHARVDGGLADAQITGRIPTETPEFTATAGLNWTLTRSLKLIGDLRYEGVRYDDDQNTLRLAPATTVDLRAEWRPRRNLAVYVEAANIFDVAAATGETAGGIYSYAPPKTVSLGVRLSGGGL